MSEDANWLLIGYLQGWLRDALQTLIEEEYQPQLEVALEKAKHEHQLRVEAALDKALAAIRGKGAVKPKAPRKPRADKGTKRLGRGMPKAEAEPKAESEL
jgi:hypothetical protein